jgi:hypothetical protein
MIMMMMMMMMMMMQDIYGLGKLAVKKLAEAEERDDPDGELPRECAGKNVRSMGYRQHTNA